MSNNKAEEQALMKAFVRGEAEPSDLSIIGVAIRESDIGCVIDEPSGLSVFEPSLEDVATGLFANWARSTSLQDWARAILGANFVDLGVLEDRPQGERLLEMLWTASAGNGLGDADVELLRGLGDADSS